MKEKKKEMFNLIAFNSYGGFSKEGDEYHIVNTDTPLPWCHVLANENFGTILSNKGTIYSYYKNSREFKLTNWCNDWTNVELGESFQGIYDAGYNLAYGFGYAQVTQQDSEIDKKMTIFIPMEDTVKIQYIELSNRGNTEEKIEISYQLEPVLGVSYEMDNQNVVSKVDNNTLLLKNPYNKVFGNVVTYLTVLPHRQCCDDMVVTFDPEQFAVKMKMTLKPQDSCHFSILLGSYENEGDNTYLIVKDKYASQDSVLEALSQTKAYWREKVKRKIETKDTYLNIMANGWLLYQTIACRLYAKSGFYQSGGATGFRDQLQDTLALISAWPEKTKSQIITHASKQFEKGDVLHWWHDHTNAGIKTYFSDDYLWLAYVLAIYVEKTKDNTILDIETYYLENKEMGSNRELYEIFSSSDKKDTIYEHAKKAILYGLSRIHPENGMLDIGDGDWNDGFSNIRGQSVWLTLFMIELLHLFKPLAELKEDSEMVDTCINMRDTLKNNVDQSAWEKEHFIRAFYENGDVLGSFSNEECRVDLISQAWAAIALKDFPDMKEKIELALDTADKYLVDKDNGIVKLLYPPFDKPKNNPGYIKAYVPGTRENGGQYTHASTWLAFAYYEMGEEEKGTEILKYINPIYHSDSKDKADIYMVEPYVMAADVYSNEEHLGRGGWTWYTGSSAWTYKVIEDHFCKESKNK